jgi:sulfate adenylyltransferase subunit 1 (EFTu-like GTPase family)
MARSATQRDHAGVDEQFRDLGDPPDVLDPRLIGEAEIAVDAVAKLVAVKQRGMAAEIAKALVHQIGDRRFAGPSLDRPLVCEAYRDNRELGSFILIDSLSRCTAAAGMIDFSLRRAHQYPLADAGRGQIRTRPD